MTKPPHSFQADIDSGTAPTLVQQPDLAAPHPAAMAENHCRPNVEATNDSLNFQNETDKLLQRRLKAAAIDLMVVLGIGYVGNWLYGNHQWLFLRTLIFIAMIASYLVLRSSLKLDTRALRSFEALLFGGVALQMSLMMYSRTEHFTKLGEAVSVVGVQHFFFTAFCLHILTYGIFVPNTWKRAAVVTTLIAFVPYVVNYIQRALLPELITLQLQNRGTAPLPTPLIAAMIATFGSHIIHRTRREAFQARQIMQYRLHELIGRGGMGEVYRAEHVLLKRRCAIKLIRAEQGRNDDVLKRFEQEVIATARLTHWNTIDIFDYGRTEDGTFYYVMELLDGENLHQLVHKYGPLSPGRAVYLIAQLCDALCEAHANGLIHRDIKPANVFAAQRGKQYDVCKVLDFGLVLDMSAAGEKVKKQGSFSGTPTYMAPEQAACYDHVDARTDIYAVGCVLYFLIAGRPPFEGRSSVELIAAHATKSVPRLDGISDDLHQVLMRALAKNPEDRFACAHDMANALRMCQCTADWSPERASLWWRTLTTCEENSQVIPNAANSLTHGQSQAIEPTLVQSQ